MTVKLWIDIVGWIGSVLVVGAYALNISGRLRADASAYLWANVFGSIGLIFNTAYIGAYPSAFVNVIWVFIALWGFWNRRKNVKISKV
jgi:hypothetical protein